jgi:hypothetical protein
LARLNGWDETEKEALRGLFFRLVEDLSVLGGAEEEGAAAEVVDLASNSLGVVVDTADEAIAKDLGLGIADAEMMLDVSGGLFEIEGTQVVADGDALAEGFEEGRNGAGG